MFYRNFILLMLGFSVVFSTHADSILTGKFKEGCNVIRDRYPDTKFCVQIYNDLDKTLNVQRLDNLNQYSLDPTNALVIFSPLLRRDITFKFWKNENYEFIEATLQNNEIIHCFDNKNILNCRAK